MSHEYVYLIIKNGTVVKASKTAYRAEQMKLKIKKTEANAIVQIEKMAVE